MANSRSVAAWMRSLGTFLRGARAPVALCYHGVAAAPPAHDPHGLVVRERDFAAQLDLLVGLGYRLTSAVELARAISEGGPRGARGMAAITFDDGLAETLRIAVRLLEERGGHGSAFVVPDLFGCAHPDLPEHRLADAAELRALVGGPLEFGSHTTRHIDLATVDEDRATFDLVTSRAAIELLLGVPVHGLAYPYGRYTEATVRAAERAGYEYACACSGAGPWRRLELPREAVFPSTTPRRLRAKAAGLYGPVVAVAEWRSRRLR